ncbi:MAG: hypothetical protein GY834_06225 [Bacteroidetes bacterium]|nr:hypothetical protein [Bacteroidota bacterium]
MKNKVKMNLNVKVFFMLIILSSLFIGAYGQVMQKGDPTGINERLQSQANDWRLIVSAYDEQIRTQEGMARQTAEDIVTAQAKVTYELIQKSLDENYGTLPSDEKKDIFNRLSRHTVGKTGYVWILDYKGHNLLSKDRERDGENLWDVKDSDGNMVIQNLISKGKSVSGTEIAYHSYPWINNDELEPREKIAAMINFPELKWVVGISTYYDDLINMDFRDQIVEKVKVLMAEQVIGKSGYIWVVNSDGVYQVSKDRLRDGEDISNAKDADGVLFIQEAITKAKASQKGAEYQVYPWKNNSESSPRTKVAGLSYVPAWDWIIGVSAYYDDFE